MSTMESQITSLTVVYSTVIQAQIKENIKAPRHWPLLGEFTDDRWIPRTKGPVTRKMFPFDDVIMPSKVWDEITYPFLNFNGSTVEVWEWLSNFIQPFIWWM